MADDPDSSVWSPRSWRVSQPRSASGAACSVQCSAVCCLQCAVQLSVQCVVCTVCAIGRIGRQNRLLSHLPTDVCSLIPILVPDHCRPPRLPDETICSVLCPLCHHGKFWSIPMLVFKFHFFVCLLCPCIFTCRFIKSSLACLTILSSAASLSPDFWLLYRGRSRSCNDLVWVGQELPLGWSKPVSV